MTELREEIALEVDSHLFLSDDVAEHMHHNESLMAADRILAIPRIQKALKLLDEYEAMNLSLQREVGMWQPIETAPTDGTEVLVARVGEVWTASFEGGCWEYSQFGYSEDRPYIPAQPTHWMPLPDPPQG